MGRWWGEEFAHRRPYPHVFYPSAASQPIPCADFPEAMEFLQDRMRRTKDNFDFLLMMNS